MPNTPVYGWPYHHLFEPPDGADLGEDLALAIEATVQTEVAALDAASDAAIAALTAQITPSVATVATSQTTTSAAYTDLTTPGPAVTVTTGTRALVVVTCRMRNNTGVNLNRMSFGVTGATTSVANDTRSVEHEGSTWQRASTVHLMTGLNSGSNTFTAKYKTSAGTAVFEDRQIIVIPLP